MKNWWIYLLIFVAFIALYLLSSLIFFMIMKSKRKKLQPLLDKILPYEKERFDYLMSIKDKITNAPKAFTNGLEALDKEFVKIPPNIADIKSQLDVLYIILLRIADEKKYGISENTEIKDKAGHYLNLDPTDKKSPYFKYNKTASHYNAYLGMWLVAMFNRKNKYTTAPIL